MHQIPTDLLLLQLSCFSHVQLCATPQMAARQTPLSLGFSRQEHWSGLPFPSPIQQTSRLPLLEGISTPPLEETEEKTRLSVFLKMVQMSIWNPSHTLGLFLICSLSFLLHTQLITNHTNFTTKTISQVTLFFFISLESYLLQAVAVSQLHQEEVQLWLSCSCKHFLLQKSQYISKNKIMRPYSLKSTNSFPFLK